MVVVLVYLKKEKKKDMVVVSFFMFNSKLRCICINTLLYCFCLEFFYASHLHEQISPATRYFENQQRPIVEEQTLWFQGLNSLGSRRNFKRDISHGETLWGIGT